MKFARFQADSQTYYGVVEDDRVRVITGPPYQEFRETRQVFPLAQVHLLAPVTPPKVLAIGLNYGSHLGDRPAPKRPEVFLKATSAVIGPQEAIVLPRDAGRVDEEAELVVVIRRRCRNIGPESALDAVLGYTCGGDISARDWQRDDLQWWRAKSCDTFAPLGPFIDTELDGTDATVIARVNGLEVQRGHTRDLLFNVPVIISSISRVITLEPGDVIYTGTPGATAPLRPGDILEIEIPGIGVLRNPVRAEPDSGP